MRIIIPEALLFYLEFVYHISPQLKGRKHLSKPFLVSQAACCIGSLIPKVV
jgi:hypothetical protein